MDILDDGTKELQEMLQALWDAIYTLMSSPVLAVADSYDIGENTSLSKEQFTEKLTELIERKHLPRCTGQNSHHHAHALIAADLFHGFLLAACLFPA